MTPKLTEEQSAAIDASKVGSVPVVHPVSNRVYFVVDAEIHKKAMDALHKRETLEAIQAGIDDMEAGNTMSVEESRRLTLEHLLSRPQ